MKPELKEYQKTAVEEMIQITRVLLGKVGRRICVLKSPTGSGKTLIMAEFLQDLSQEISKKNLGFIWVSAHSLHQQSKEKIEKYLEHSVYRFSYLEDIQNNIIAQNEILFVNWEELTKKDKISGNDDFSNIFMRDNESGRNLPNFINNAKREGREIILIIDESHYYYWGDNAQELADSIIDPKLIIEVSATPRSEISISDVKLYDAGWVEVPFEAVVAEGMVKSKAFINEEFEKLVIGSDSSDEVVINAALKKREEILDLYQGLSVNINPLVLIQLPSQEKGTSILDRQKIDIVQDLLNKRYGITVDNGRLAIWLSEEKKNLDGIASLNSQVEVLIFKQAIALGWDCPRSQILVMFKEIQSVVFKIQTIGRIMRMPEARHYDNEILNRAYIFTNLERIIIDQDSADQKYFYKNAGHRQGDEYKDINIPSVYRQRIDQGDLTFLFRKLFMRAANNEFRITEEDSPEVACEKVGWKFDLQETSFTAPVISDGIIKDIDKIELIIGKTINLPVPEEDVKENFNYIAKALSYPFAPIRSFTKIQQAIYDWFDRYLGYGNKSRLIIQKIFVCSASNQNKLREIVETAKAEFKTIRDDQIGIKNTIRENTKWNVPVIDYYSELYEEFRFKKYIMSPCYLHKQRSGPEKAFEPLLDNSLSVVWWYKNGVEDEKYLGITYADATGRSWTFYPDYIVKYKDGSLGIYDTKGGMTAGDSLAKNKAEALQGYLLNLRKNGVAVSGGIIVKDSKGWFINNKTTYRYDSSMADWDKFEI